MLKKNNNSLLYYNKSYTYICKKGVRTMDMNDLIKDEFFKQAIEDVKTGKKSIDELDCTSQTREYIKLYLQNEIK